MEARYSRDKSAVLARANLRLEKLRVLLRLCHALGYLTGRYRGHTHVRFNPSGPLRGIKGNLYEGGVRVPIVAGWPGTIRLGVCRAVSGTSALCWLP